MTDEHLLKLMRDVDLLTARVPPGVRAIANAVEADTIDACVERLEYFGKSFVGEDGISPDQQAIIAAMIAGCVKVARLPKLCAPSDVVLQ